MFFRLTRFGTRCFGAVIFMNWQHTNMPFCLQGFFVSIIYCYCNGEVGLKEHPTRLTYLAPDQLLNGYRSDLILCRIPRSYRTEWAGT